MSRARMLADLARSGLTARDAKRLEFEVLSPDDTAVMLGSDLLRFHSYRIPYFDINGERTDFFRVRFLEDVKDKNGRLLRYMQPGGSEPQPYFPPGVEWARIARDPTVLVTITEGEKKAAAGCKHGLNAIGLGGVWSFQPKGAPSRLLEQLESFEWHGRQVEICYDA